jgi:PAS domain S-box-containing protein
MLGNLNKEQLEAVLETMPIEFSVVDANDEVIAWNKHATRIFKRPASVIGKNVKDCHPKKSLAKVEAILTEMKNNQREQAEFWIDMNINNKPEKILIQYFALRNNQGKYLGCLEASQKITHLQKLQGEKRLLD